MRLPSHAAITLAVLFATLGAGADVAGGASRGEAAAPDPPALGPIAEAPPPRRAPTIRYWAVTVEMRVGAGTGATSVRMLLPVSDGRQSVLSRVVRPSAFRFAEEPAGENLWARWDGAGRAADAERIEYHYTVRTTDRWTEVPRLPVEANPPPPGRGHALAATPTIQADAPDIVARANALTATATRVDEIAWGLYRYTASLHGQAGPRDAADALGVLQAGGGDPSGKARLLTALLRSRGIPARLVGGLRLEDAVRTRTTIAWVEAWLGGRWVPFDPGGGHYAFLPASYVALHYGDLPLIEHTGPRDLAYDMLVHQVTRQTLLDEASSGAAPGVRARQVDWETDRVRTFAFYAERPVASVVMITDHAVPDTVIEQVVADARARAISVVFLSARFESRYFRESYLQRLIASHFGAIAESHLLLVSTKDEAGLYALLQLGEQRLALQDARIVVAGGYPRGVGRVLGSVIYRLVDPGELVLVNPRAPLPTLWRMARANLLDGVPMAEAAAAWDVRPLVIGRDDGDGLGRWRRYVVGAWSEAVVAQVPLQAINLILVLPVIACIVVIFRSVVGVETFGTFAPVIVSLAFLMTGLVWGLAIFAVIVGLGVLLRGALQWFRIQLVARLAILIALVSAMMAGLTVGGAYLGVGALLNISIFPMVIMSNVIENFTTTQTERGTREALRLTGNTLLVCTACYGVIETAGLQAIILSFPELLVGVIVLEIVIGKWRGLRLLEYARFYELARGKAAS